MANQEEGITIDSHGVYWAVWRDHANRIVRAKITGSTPQQRKREAFEAVEKYKQRMADRMETRSQMSEDELYDLAGECSFPREVVADLIWNVCKRVAVEAGITIDPEKKRLPLPAMNLFLDRTKERMSLFGSKGLTDRDMFRILEEHDRITVSQEIVDGICCEFNKNMNEVIESAMEWASKTGAWESRIGSEDSWPVGYSPVKKKKEMCDEWPDCDPSKKSRCLLCPFR